MKNKIFALLLATSSMLALAACGTRPATSAPSSASEPPVSSAVVQSASAVSSENNSNQNPALPSHLQFVTLAEKDELKDSWYYIDEANTKGSSRYLYQYKFDEIEGQVMLGHGLEGTDGGIFYWGPYTLLDNGVVQAVLTRSSWEPDPAAKEFEISFIAEYSPENPAVRVFTLSDIGEGADDEFLQVFEAIKDKQLTFSS